MHLDSFDCALCLDATEETMDHLFLTCPFANSCWSQIGVTLQSQSSIFLGSSTDEGSNPTPILHDNSYSHVLGYLDSKK